MKAVLFDIDHTLYDYEVTHAYAMKYVFAKIQKITGTERERSFRNSIGYK